MRMLVLDCGCLPLEQGAGKVADGGSVFAPRQVPQTIPVVFLFTSNNIFHIDNE